MDASAAQQQTASPNGTAKLSNHSPQDGHHDWSADDRSSDDEAHDRSQPGASNKRKRPLSVSCETCSKSPTAACKRRRLLTLPSRAAQGQVRPRVASVFVVPEEPLCMRELRIASPGSRHILNHAQVYLPRKKPGLRAGYGRELESRLGKSCRLLAVCRGSRGFHTSRRKLTTTTYTLQTSSKPSLCSSRPRSTTSQATRPRAPTPRPRT